MNQKTIDQEIFQTAIFSHTFNIARDYNQLHETVLQVIDHIEKYVPEEFFRQNFHKYLYKLPETGNDHHRMYLVTRDGYDILSMSLTGKEAMESKMKFIEIFKCLESQLDAIDDYLLKNNLNDLFDDIQNYINTHTNRRKVFGCDHNFY